MMVIQILRKCNDCGLEAHTQDDLQKFSKNAASSYGYQNLCLECSKIRTRKWRNTNRGNLLNRFKLMKQRCYNPKDISYSYCGNKGIIICQEWLDNPDAFIDWALINGFHKELQIDRIDNDGPYRPDNCRWVSAQIQQRNRKNNITNFVKGTRICTQCKVEKPLEDFHRNKSMPEGRNYTCKSCRKKKKDRRKLI